MVDKRNAEQEGKRAEGTQDIWNAGNLGWKTIGMQDWRYAGQAGMQDMRDAGQEGCRTRRDAGQGWMQDMRTRRDAGQKPHLGSRTGGMTGVQLNSKSIYFSPFTIAIYMIITV